MELSPAAAGRCTVALLVASLLLVVAPVAGEEPPLDDVEEAACTKGPEICSQLGSTSTTVEQAPDAAGRLLQDAVQSIWPDTPTVDGPTIQLTCSLTGAADPDAEGYAVLDCTPTDIVIGLVPLDGSPGPCEKSGEDLECTLPHPSGTSDPDATLLGSVSPLAERTHLGSRMPSAPVDGSGNPLSGMAGSTRALAGPAVPHQAALVAATATLALGIALLVLYRRLSRDEVLDNDLRARIVEIVAERPGVHASDLADELDVAVTTVLYHGRILAEADKLVVRRSDGRVRYLSGDEAASWRERELQLAMDGGTKGRLLETLADEPGLSMSDIGRRLDRARNTVKHHVDDLIDRGLVLDRSEGRTTKLHVHPEVRDAVGGG